MVEEVDGVRNEESPVRTLTLSSDIGLDTIPDQIVLKLIKKGYKFNILCIGETGLGKSTLMDSLFNTSFASNTSPHNISTVKLISQTSELQENNLRFELTMVETVGYGDQINREGSYQPILDYIDNQFEAYLQEELKINRSLTTYQDTRIHVCLYFICPTGHGLKSLDLICMKKLDNKVNIIPIISKADALSKSELETFKTKIMKELSEQDVQIYKFPTDDDQYTKINNEMNLQLPFAVIGSTDFIHVENKMIRCRQYPWGVVQIENESHCDFLKLRKTFLYTNMEDMKEKTHYKHYDLYRKKRLEQMGLTDDCSNLYINIQQSYIAMKKQHLEEKQQKENELQQKFLEKIKKNEAELYETEKKLKAKFDKLDQEFAEESRKFEDAWKKNQNEITEFNNIKAFFLSKSNSSMLTRKRSYFLNK